MAPWNDEDDLVAALPPMMAVALRLVRAGQPDQVIATAVGIPVEGVPALVELAEAKLDGLRRDATD